MRGMRVPCKYCDKLFLNKETLKTHYKVIHRTEKKYNLLYICVIIALKQRASIVKNMLCVLNYLMGFTSVMNVWLKLLVSSVLLK